MHWLNTSMVSVMQRNIILNVARSVHMVNTKILVGARALSTTKFLNYKKVSACIDVPDKKLCSTVQEKQNGNILVIEGLYVEHPKAQYMLKTIASNTEQCSVCALGVDVKHTDVMILSQFLRPDGCMLPRRITKLCRRQQKSIGTMVSMAQKAGLMPNLTPAYSKKDPQQRQKWKKFNTYFDETTIFRRKTLPKYC